MSSRPVRSLLAVAVALLLGSASAAVALQPGATAGPDRERAEQPRKPDTPPGHDRRPDHAGPGDGGGGGGGDVEDPSLAPFDYIAQAPQLSQPVHDQVTTEVLELQAHDGETLYLEVTKPVGEGPFPVILEASPYHGTLADRAGTRMFPDPTDAEGNLLGLTGYFAPRGYAVAMMDLRGTGRSTGCLDHLGANDAADLALAVETLAAAPWSNGRVGMTGHSYVGSTPVVAAAQDPEGLVTIAPSAGLASMYDHQFHQGVPWNLQWIGPMVAYEGLAIDRDLPPGSPAIPVIGSGKPGDNWTYRGGQPNPQFGCGLPNSAALSGPGQVTGQYEAWHAQRDWREAATAADIPVFMIHGVHDNAARIPAAEWYFGGRFDQASDKVWIGQWDHGSTNGRCGDPTGTRVAHPTCRFEQFQYALHAWFDHHLLQRDVETGPAVEAFLNAEDAVDVTQVVDPESLDSKVYATDSWRAPAERLTLHPDASDMTLGPDAPTEPGSASFQTAAEGVLANVGRGTATFTGEPVAEDTLVLGVSDLTLHASVTNPLTHLVASLWRVDAEGDREPVDFCAIQPQLREGVDQVAPVVPGEVMALDLSCFTVAQWIPAGQHLELDISTGSQHHATFGDTGQVTVHTGPDLPSAWSAPRIADFTLHDDVPLRSPEEEPAPAGPAQAPASGSVAVPAPGGGLVVEPVTAAAFEFESTDEDNASVEVLATPSLPADLDIYLERRLEDGTWEELAVGETFDLEKEVLSGPIPALGTYRILVHSFAGPPNQVEVVVTFRNRDGQPGTA